ncbi:protoporphyrinogen/coproporphyrinogen oxidase [Meiothermus taiwanensis]|jgi:oxygen-dependent protoporphyrinogen oxidase|uniref:Protoporphyrinogen oxidase n=2 Tax=Meiothermus taiwanensis TaxID=172827 RepID=A0A399DV12_9DEIN|nr:FAD-dependent oxidoreductase [Meiothermus taiwanensis]AWR86108.1 protoporphyrinogen oxidase [Meiothermus taiwanensis WR-220]KIQ55693.1 protoporphyrinogen oxidase [Meiothermus taiwanensis]KZK15026.1 protoporphyrinogen oxidase [Meiothermus taiwanensis]RIH76024.1 Protoporphyrinogen oxidase [Meiothermus taiwanensis]
MSRVVVVGGGLSGLAVAYWVAEAGLEVSLLEATHRLGGYNQTAQLEGQALELGDEYFEEEPDTLLGLCRHLGLEPRPQPHRPQVVRCRGRDWVLPPGLNPATGFGLHQLSTLPFSRRTKWRLATERWVAPAALRDEPVDAFFCRRLGPEVWEVLAPYMEAMLGGPAGEAATVEACPALPQLELQGGVMAGSRRLRAQGQWHLLDGMGGLVQALATRLQQKARIFVGQEALAVTHQAGRWVVHVPGGRLEAEAVVVALPAPQAARVFRPSSPQLTTWLNQFPYQHSAKVFLLYRPAQPMEGPVDYYWAKAEGYTGTALRQTPLDSGLVLARVQFAGEVARRADTELSRLAQQDLSRFLQAPAHPLAAWVFRQPFSRPQFAPGHTRRVAALEQALVHAPGLFLSGGYLAGPGLARQVAHSHQVTQRLLNFMALSEPRSD